MKTETQIAKDNIKKMGHWERMGNQWCIWEGVCQSHLASCQRFSEFLEDLHNLRERKNRIIKRESTEGVFGNLKQYKKAKAKYGDLQNAIKIYLKEDLK